MNAGTYQVNISYRLNLASLRRLNTELTNIARRFRVIPVSVKVSGNITAVKSQLSDMKKRYRNISSKVNITSNINTINSQLNKLNNRKITVPVNYTGNTPRAPSVTNPSGGRSAKGGSNNRRSTVTRRIGRGIASRGIYDAGTTVAQIPLSAVKTAASYEEVMIDIKSTLAALGDGTPKQIAEMDNLIKKIGLTTKFTSTEAAKAAQMLIRNGVSAQGILDGMLESTVSTSIVMRSDLSTTADLMTDVIAFYRDMGVSAEEASNKIVAGTLTSKFGLNDMYHALANGGTEAANYGVKLEELTAIISLISPSFKSGRKAGTSFVWFLRSFSGKSDKSVAAMKEMGLKLTDNYGKWKSTRDIIKELTRVFGPMEAAERTAAIRSVFHGEAINTVNGLLREGVVGYDAMLKKQGEMDTAELARVKSNNGLSMAYSQLTSAVDALYKVIVNDPVLQWMTEFTKTITESIRWISNLIKKLDVLKNNKVWKMLTWNPKDLAKKWGEKIYEFDNDVSFDIENAIGGAYDKLRKKLRENGILGYDGDKKPDKETTIPQAYTEYGRVRTGEDRLNNPNALGDKTNSIINQYISGKINIGNPKPVPVIIKHDPSSSTSYMDYLDKEQKQVLRPTTSSSSINNSASKTVIFNKGAIQFNGNGDNPAHTVKDTGKEIVNVIKRQIDSDDYPSFEVGGA